MSSYNRQKSNGNRNLCAPNNFNVNGPNRNSATSDNLNGNDINEESLSGSSKYKTIIFPPIHCMLIYGRQRHDTK